MPNVVMLAKSTLVWLDQLSKTYGYPINTLDQIPDYELDLLAERGFTSLWLIGLWERSTASKKIKNLCGNLKPKLLLIHFTLTILPKVSVAGVRYTI